MPNNIICNVEWALYRNNIQVLAGLSKRFLEHLELTIFGSSYGEGNGTPPQYSCLENPVDRGAWWATVRGVAPSQAWLRWPCTHARTGHHAVGSFQAWDLGETLRLLESRQALSEARVSLLGRGGDLRRVTRLPWRLPRVLVSFWGWGDGRFRLRWFLGAGAWNLCWSSCSIFSSALLFSFRAVVVMLFYHSFRWDLPVHKRQKRCWMSDQGESGGRGLALSPLAENSLEQTYRLLFPRTEAASVNSEFSGWSVICFLKIHHLLCNKGLCYLVDKPSCCVSFI